MITLSECRLMPEYLAMERPREWDALRASAEKALDGLDFPTTKEEDWKYTDLKAMAGFSFKPGMPVDVDIKNHVMPESVGSRLVFVNGFLAPHLSNVTGLPCGVRLLSLRSASEAVKDLGSLVKGVHADIFAHLNSARFQDGAFLYIPKGVTVQPVIHVIFLSEQSGDTATCSLPRLVVHLERGASATLVEEYAGNGRYATNAVAEVHLGENARLVHERVQRDSSEAFHFCTLGAKLEKASHYVCRTISLGACFSRQNPKIWLAAEGAELELNGLALLDKEQFSDTHSLIEHAVPHCTSRQLHKVVLDGKTRGVFNGKILVNPGAQKTDARQQARCLLLSGEARVDAKPELEIFADDVKCAHGAAIGQLDAEEIFYLQSRGLSLEHAKNLLTYGFAADVLSPIKVESLKKQLRNVVMAHTGTTGI